MYTPRYILFRLLQIHTYILDPLSTVAKMPAAEKSPPGLIKAFGMILNTYQQKRALKCSRHRFSSINSTNALQTNRLIFNRHNWSSFQGMSWDMYTPEIRDTNPQILYRRNQIYFSRHKSKSARRLTKSSHGTPWGTYKIGRAHV